MSSGPWALVAAALVAASGCGSHGAGRGADAGVRSRGRDAGPRRAPEDAGSDAGVVIERASVLEPPARADEESAGTEPVGVRRIVYELVLQSRGAGAARAGAIAPATVELRVDVSASRLRARFGGMGAPVEAGSEVRLEAGADGAYLFDSEGGRPVGAGALAAWLDGRARGSARGRVAVELDPPPPRAPRTRADASAALDAGTGTAEVQPDPPPTTTRPSGGLVCALLAELAGARRASLVRRCARGAPRAFTLGPWRGTRTIDVDVDLPAEALRADDALPPVRIARSVTRAFFAPSVLAALEPVGGAGGVVTAAPASADVPAEGLLVVNESESRAIVTVQGVATGWVAAGESAQFVGFRAGRYAVGAVSPLGTVLARPALVGLPARWVVR